MEVVTTASSEMKFYLEEQIGDEIDGSVSKPIDAIRSYNYRL